MVALVGAVLLGNLLAICVHCGCWKLRRRAMPRLGIIGCFGLLGFAGVVYFRLELALLNSFLIDADGVKIQLSDPKPAQLIVLGQSFLLVVFTMVAAVLQFRNIPASLGKAFLAVWAEVVAGFLAVLGLSLIFGSSIFDQWLPWITVSFVCSMIALSVMPPWVRRILFSFCKLSAIGLG